MSYWPPNSFEPRRQPAPAQPPTAKPPAEHKPAPAPTLIARDGVEIVDTPRTRVLLAAVAIYQRQGRVTIREIAEAVDRAPSVVLTHLRVLRAAGLVTWAPGHARGTLRPLVTAVRFGQEKP